MAKSIKSESPSIFSQRDCFLKVLCGIKLGHNAHILFSRLVTYLTYCKLGYFGMVLI